MLSFKLIFIWANLLDACICLSVLLGRVPHCLWCMDIENALDIWELVLGRRLLLLELPKVPLLPAAVLTVADLGHRWNALVGVLLLVLADLTSHLIVVLLFLALTFFGLLDLPIVELSLLFAFALLANLRDEEAAEASALLGCINMLRMMEHLLDWKSWRSSWSIHSLLTPRVHLYSWRLTSWVYRSLAACLMRSLTTSGWRLKRTL